jgi:pimeloyl-ACP methyl ester carboxylesterase
MPALELHGTRIEFLEQGRGETVILLHSSASSGAQWRSLAAKLSGRYRVLAPDFYGCGGSGAWSGGAFSLEDEAEIVLALLRRSGGPAHLVGHSYGGAVALQVALRHGGRLRSLTLIEPVAFHLLRENEALDAAAFAEISALAARVRRAFIDGDSEGGMARFVDYWSGPGAWANVPPAKRPALAARLAKVGLDFDATFGEATRLQDFWALFVPVLLLQGSASPLPTRRICGQLARVLSDARIELVEGAGHMLPLTHAGRVDALVAAHLEGSDARLDRRVGGEQAADRPADAERLDRIGQAAGLQAA